CPRRSPRRILTAITTPLGPTLLPEFLERQLAVLFAQEAQEPLVVPRVDVEQPRDEPVVATRRFEPPSNHLAQRAARDFAMHVRRVDAGPERLVFLGQPFVQIVGDGTPALPRRPEAEARLRPHGGRQILRR